MQKMRAHNKKKELTFTWLYGNLTLRYKRGCDSKNENEQEKKPYLC